MRKAASRRGSSQDKHFGILCMWKLGGLVHFRNRGLVHWCSPHIKVDGPKLLALLKRVNHQILWVCKFSPRSFRGLELPRPGVLFVSFSSCWYTHLAAKISTICGLTQNLALRLLNEEGEGTDLVGEIPTWATYIYIYIHIHIVELDYASWLSSLLLLWIDIISLDWIPVIQSIVTFLEEVKCLSFSRHQILGMVIGRFQTKSQLCPEYRVRIRYVYIYVWTNLCACCRWMGSHCGVSFTRKKDII